MAKYKVPHLSDFGRKEKPFNPKVPVVLSIRLEKMPRARVCQTVDKTTGEVIKGVFIPEDNTTGVRASSRGGIVMRLCVDPVLARDSIKCYRVLPGTLGTNFRMRTRLPSIGIGYPIGQLEKQELIDYDNQRVLLGEHKLYTYDL